MSLASTKSLTIQICKVRYVPRSKRVRLDWEKDDKKGEDQEGGRQIRRESHSVKNDELCLRDDNVAVEVVS